MKPESEAMLRILLEIQRFRCWREPLPHRDECTIAYGEMCREAGVPFLIERPGPFLLEFAEWCATRGLPPINALAVNKSTGRPGFNYDVAPGCDSVTWVANVDAVIRERNYPEAN